jgi:hypothetical protein
MPSKTFDLETCKDMLAKLRRERERLVHSTSRDERADHATNAMITAWQIKDWVLADAERDAATKTAITSLCASSAGGVFREANFAQLLYQECPSLRYCFLVATDTKHAAIYPHLDDPNVETTASLTYAQSRSLGTLGSSHAIGTTDTVWQKDRWMFKIVDSGDLISDVQIVDDAITYWSKFLLKFGIG